MNESIGAPTATKRADRAPGISETSKDLPGGPPPVSVWATRADLLRDRADALHRLHRADLSLRTLTLTLLIIVVAGVGTTLVFPFWFGLEETDPVLRPDPTAAEYVAGGLVLGMFGLPAIGLYWWMARRAIRARQIGSNFKAWQDVADTKEARALPRGDLAPELREPFDARQDTDFDEHALVLLARMYAAPFDKRLMARGFLTGCMTPVGGVLAVMPFLPPTEGQRMGMLGVGIGGGVLLVASLIQFGKVVGRSYRATQRWRRYKKEYRLWSTGRPTGSVWAQESGESASS